MMRGGLLGVIFLVGLSACAPKVVEPIEAGFSSPEATFETWRQAASNLDFPMLLSTYDSASRSKIEKDISTTSQEGLKEMQREVRGTKFTIEKIVYEENKAYLRVLRKRGRIEDVEVLNMIKESGDWKIIP